MLKPTRQLAAGIAALALLTACNSKTDDGRTLPSGDPVEVVALKHYEDAEDLAQGTRVTVSSGVIEMYDADVMALCLWSGDSDPPACFEKRFVLLGVPQKDVTWEGEKTDQRPEYRYGIVTNLEGRLVSPGVIEVDTFVSTCSRPDGC